MENKKLVLGYPARKLIMANGKEIEMHKLYYTNGATTHHCVLCVCVFLYKLVNKFVQ